jgi:hypothetical protein
MSLEIGKVARLIAPEVKGEIKDTQYNKGAKCLEHLVEWQSADGEMHQRWFLESELEEVPAPAQE